MNESLEFSHTASAQLQYKINTSIIFNYLRQKSPISRSEISRNLKISAPAVSRVIKKLIETDYILEIEKQKTMSGKRPTLLSINKDAAYLMAIDLGKENLKIAITNFNGEIIEKYNGFKLTDNNNLIEKMIIAIKEFLNHKNNIRIIENKKLKISKRKI